MSRTIQQQVRLPLRKAVQIAWRNLRVRWWRSMLVTSGIILALSFLTYVLASDAIWRAVADSAFRQAAAGEGKLLEDLTNRRLIAEQTDAAAGGAQTWWLVGLALLVSFVGILNAMLMSVTERFAEIGTMKCLGALDGFIVKLFLLESAFQGTAGTVAGAGVGFLLAVVEALATYGWQVAWAAMPWADLGRILAACLVAGTALTIVAGLYPAWRAARMQPVDAMRTEV
jgi:predicted lysophospholipase L1 biosynthesis ABC-type transport system permease subunit